MSAPHLPQGVPPSLETCERVRAACELLFEVAAVQVQYALHPDAPVVLAWIDRLGATAAQGAGRAASAPAAPALPQREGSR